MFREGDKYTFGRECLECARVDDEPPADVALDDTIVGLVYVLDGVEFDIGDDVACGARSRKGERLGRGRGWKLHRGGAYRRRKTAVHAVI